MIFGIFRLVQSFSFRWTVIMGYIFLLFIGLEIWLEPSLAKVKPFLLSLVVISALWFSISVVFVSAPIDIIAYSMPRGDYAPGTKIGGIEWDGHMTDLRTAITNPSQDDYQDLDISVQPDKWTHKAAILGNTTGCGLTALNGETISFARAKQSGKLTMTSTRVGSGFDVHDSSGNTYETLATEFGYRLRCGSLPSNFTVQLVFAVVSIGPNLRRDPSGNWNLMAMEFAGAKSAFELLDTKPAPSKIIVKATYRSKIKNFSVTKDVIVMAGN
jgi:hypothetical protein